MCTLWVVVWTQLIVTQHFDDRWLGGSLNFRGISREIRGYCLAAAFIVTSLCSVRRDRALSVFTDDADGTVCLTKTLPQSLENSASGWCWSENLTAYSHTNWQVTSTEGYSMSQYSSCIYSTTHKFNTANNMGGVGQNRPGVLQSLIPEGFN